MFTIAGLSRILLSLKLLKLLWRLWRLPTLKGDMAEWLGRGLQNLLRRFESACRLISFYNYLT